MKNTIQSFKCSFLGGVLLLLLCTEASAGEQVEDKVRTFPDVTVVRPFLNSLDKQPECREWADNFQLLSSSNKGDLFFRIRVRDVPKSNCAALTRVAGRIAQFVLRSSESMPEELSGQPSETYWTGEWKITERLNVARVEEQLNGDEVQVYQPTDTLTEAWDDSCVSVFDKIVVSDGNARKTFYLLAISNENPFLRRFDQDFSCPNWQGRSSASQYVATFDIDGGALNEGAFFFDRSFGTLLLPRSRVEDFCIFVSELGVTYAYLSEYELRQVLASEKLFASVAGMVEQSFEVSRDESRDAAIRLLQNFGKCDRW
ncbi:hypothetical protein [Taklimakanibacter albus]|uniref:Uncharacterized protein n=1 Tax=Taklimakanibacter albus TaxID=2800327 RepID=A0ACC5R721_9HYPH|nr:hypothetical protein [Aestuariivirga sp. YIM B02566]MBK1868417.1 hypothetical protein [Aestuariivirga sp. YIM B02566]